VLCAIVRAVVSAPGGCRGSVARKTVWELLPGFVVVPVSGSGSRWDGGGRVRCRASGSCSPSPERRTGHRFGTRIGSRQVIAVNLSRASEVIPVVAGGSASVPPLSETFVLHAGDAGCGDEVMVDGQPRLARGATVGDGVYPLSLHGSPDVTWYVMRGAVDGDRVPGRCDVGDRDGADVVGVGVAGQLQRTDSGSCDCAVITILDGEAGGGGGGGVAAIAAATACGHRRRPPPQERAPPASTRWRGGGTSDRPATSRGPCPRPNKINPAQTRPRSMQTRSDHTSTNQRMPTQTRQAVTPAVVSARATCGSGLGRPQSGQRRQGGANHLAASRSVAAGAEGPRVSPRWRQGGCSPRATTAAPGCGRD
jgi:hypothetical protein